jgi:hypothetical protein
MLRNPDSMMMVAGIGVGLLMGCGQTQFPNALDPTLEQVNSIRDSDSLDPQEKRDALAAFGIDPVTINGLLVDERLANQFGGDLSSAYQKVANNRMTELTPDEVQHYGDATDITSYSDEEAQAIFEFLNETGDGISSRDELRGFLDDPTSVLPTEIDETVLRNVFVETGLSVVRDKLP